MSRLSQHRHVAGVFGALAVSVVILPTFADVAIHDDWVYSRVAYNLSELGRLEVPPHSAVYAIFDGAWGALFSLPFGFSLGALRFASVVLVALSALALYGLALELGARCERAALATAVYLFNPLTLVLAFTYMTDSHVMALVTIAIYLYVRAWKRGRLSDAFLGSVVATFALLSRNTGIVVALGAAAYAFRRREWRRAAAVGGLPVAVALGLELWYSAPSQMGSREEQVVAGLRDLHATWDVGLVVAFLALIYIGIFALPLVATSRLRLPPRPVPLVALVAVGLTMINGLTGRFAPPARMPYGRDWLNGDGLGPLALVGTRSPFPGWILVVLGIAAVAGAVAAAWIIFSTKAGVMGWLGVALGLSLVPTGFVFMPPLDRYFLVLFPVALGILAAAQEERRRTVIGWVCVGIMALYAVAGTHDYLTLQKETWDLAEATTRDGVALTQLDAGGGWVGWKFSFYQPETHVSTPNPPWWLGWGSVDSTYVISIDVHPEGYGVVRTVELDTWLSRPDTIVLSRRNGP